jgi:hypothetical protein
MGGRVKPGHDSWVWGRREGFWSSEQEATRSVRTYVSMADALGDQKTRA